MIGQYLSNKNENVTVAKSKFFSKLNKASDLFGRDVLLVHTTSLASSHTHARLSTGDRAHTRPDLPKTCVRVREDISGEHICMHASMRFALFH